MTQNINELLNRLPIERIAERLGEDPQQVRSATEQILPSLLAGMGANAQDPAGRDSLAAAVQQHDPSLAEGEVDVDAIDTADGAKIAGHVFGDNQDAVATKLGGLGASSGLVRKLLPLLAPLVMSWLAGQMSQRGADNAQADTGKGGTGGLLEQILSQGLGGGILGQVLGGLLGGGRR